MRTVLASVLATQPPPFEVAEGARCVPVGDLVQVADPPDGFVVIGTGKRQWMRAPGCSNRAPRRSHRLDTATRRLAHGRAYFQPGSGAGRTFEGVRRARGRQQCASPWTRLRAARAGQGDAPARPHGAADDGQGPHPEHRRADGLRRIEDVVRRGHVRRIERDQIVLDEGRSRRRPVTSTSTAPPRPSPRPHRVLSSSRTRSRCSASRA